MSSADLPMHRRGAPAFMRELGLFQSFVPYDGQPFMIRVIFDPDFVDIDVDGTQQLDGEPTAFIAKESFCQALAKQNLQDRAPDNRDFMVFAGARYRVASCKPRADGTYRMGLTEAG